MDCLKYIGGKLKVDGYREVARGIFSKKIKGDCFGWISITGNQFFLSVAVGVLFSDINKIAYEILSQVFPGSREHQLDPRLGPPLVILPLHTLTAGRREREGKLNLDQSAAEITHEYADEICASIVASAYPFFEINNDLKRAIDSAVSYSKFGQAQKYLIPVGMAYLHQFDLLAKYGRECVDTFTEPELRGVYIRFLDLVLDRFRESDGEGTLPVIHET